MIVLIADIHFIKDKIESQLEFFEKQFFPYLLEHNIENVICCGDIFQDRIKVDIFLLQELRYRFFSWFSTHRVILHYIIGNHDIYFSNSLQYNIAKAAGIDLMMNIHVIDSITTLNINRYKIAMIPWITDKDVILPKADICCCHGEVKSFQMVKGIECKDGMSLSDFDDYKLTISGHFHIRSNKKDFHYIGNPYQKDWSDFKECKGFAVLDDNYNLTYIENNVSTKHLKILYTDKTIMVQGE